ncbi:MAG TPA: 23S rRNA (pseudouridine(1915)-N(3))-methyltransferase RlmH [Sediminibacterium sp.]|nr:23S rRNA (pseudouridine(1915)-N(3))-methyltransferase RlmH [Sediminibacterium sp.]
MKFQFWSVGKPHESYIREGVELFTKRIVNYFPAEWLLINPPKNAASLPDTALKKTEAVQVLSLLQPDDYLVLLDERGKQLQSPELAAWLQQRANSGIRRLIFLIGGAYGVDPALQKRADFTWSLSKLVFPHMLVRLILAEQIYRACTIIRNEKYHHS